MDKKHIGRKKHFSIKMIYGIVLLVLALSVTLIILSLNSKKGASTNSGTISASPSSGPYAVGEEFNISIIVSGGGQAYTGFSANISTTNLTVVGMPSVLQEAETEEELNAVPSGEFLAWTIGGDPHYSPLKLNFTGGVKNSRTADLTIYTLTVKAPAVGTASINISNGHIYHLNEQSEQIDIIQSMVSGSYTITEATITPPGDTDITTDAGDTTPGVGSTTSTTNNTSTGTCYDKKKNGNETGIDCGGSCKKCTVSGTTGVSSNTTGTTATSAPTETLVESLLKLPEEASFKTKWETATTTTVFRIDATASDTAVVVDQDKLTGVSFSGKALPGTKIDLFVFSEQQHYSAVADETYNWKILSDQPVSSDTHNAYTVLTDKNTGNFFRTETAFAFSVDAPNKRVQKISTETTQASTDISKVATMEPEKSIFDNKTLLMIAVIVFVVIVGAIVGFFILRKKKLAKTISGLGISKLDESPKEGSDIVPENKPLTDFFQNRDKTINENPISEVAKPNIPSENSEPIENEIKTETPSVGSPPVPPTVDNNLPQSETPPASNENQVQSPFDQEVNISSPSESVEKPETPVETPHGYNYSGFFDEKNQAGNADQNASVNSEPEAPANNNQDNSTQNNSQS